MGCHTAAEEVCTGQSIKPQWLFSYHFFIPFTIATQYFGYFDNAVSRALFLISSSSTSHTRHLSCGFLPFTLLFSIYFLHQLFWRPLRAATTQSGKTLRAKVSSRSTCDCTPGVIYDPWSEDNVSPITAQTKIPDDGRIQLKTRETPGNTYICDHIVELQMVKEVLQKDGGACDEAFKFANKDGNTAAMAIKKLSIIRKHTWKHQNLFMLETSVENRKGSTAKSGGTSLGGYKGKWHKINEVYSLVVDGPGEKAPDTAIAIDAEILVQFPDSSTEGISLESKWKMYAGLVTAAWERELCEARKKQQRAGGAAGGGVGGGKKMHPPTLSAKLLRRHRSGLLSLDTAPSSSALNPVGISSLVSRARTGAKRSGPHAPPGRCCPVSKQPQKKIVPRKQVKQAPPPTTKPRKPTLRPAPRPANPKKQVAKRPASRSRREVGKPRVQKRVTPKRKPKIVPKPTRRPRGNPRQRRRRR